MNGLDLAILLILCLFLVKGLWKGLIRQLCSLAGIVLGIFLSWSFSDILGPELARLSGWSPRVSVVVVGAMLFFAGVLAFFILGFYLGKLAKQPVLAVLNRFSGALFGVIEGVVILAVVIYLLSLWPMVARKAVVQASTLAPPFVQLGAVILQDTPVAKPR
jgi:membrane protein required for colicin V production